MHNCVSSALVLSESASYVFVLSFSPLTPPFSVAALRANN